MAAVPKTRVSKSRRDKRRSQDMIKVNKPNICSKCESPKLPHKKCPNCGFYK